MQEPEDGQNERNVGEKVDQGQPVDGQRVHAVEAHEGVADDGILETHEGITG